MGSSFYDPIYHFILMTGVIGEPNIIPGAQLKKISLSTDPDCIFSISISIADITVFYLIIAIYFLHRIKNGFKRS